MPELVSIITPMYSARQFIASTIKSVQAQTYQNWEIIFWDNASTDNSAAIAQSYDNRLRYYLSAGFTSLGMARELAVQKSNGEYVAFLDCDDVFLPGKLRKQVCEMQSGNFGMCYGSAYHINKNGDVLGKRKALNKKGKLFRKLLINYDINMQTVMIESSLIKKFNLNFNQELEFSPDYDLFMQIALNHCMLSVGDKLVKYRKHGDSLTYASIDIMAKESRYALRKIQKTISPLEENAEHIQSAITLTNFYEALLFIQKGQISKARKKILISTQVKKKYYFYYFLTFLPLSHKSMLKIILKG